MSHRVTDELTELAEQQIDALAAEYDLDERMLLDRKRSNALYVRRKTDGHLVLIEVRVGVACTCQPIPTTGGADWRRRDNGCPQHGPVIEPP